MCLFCLGIPSCRFRAVFFCIEGEIDRMADNQTEKQKVQELTDKLERGLILSIFLYTFSSRNF